MTAVYAFSRAARSLEWRRSSLEFRPKVQDDT
jgi:hypothetical protein